MLYRPRAWANSTRASLSTWLADLCRIRNLALATLAIFPVLLAPLALVLLLAAAQSAGAATIGDSDEDGVLDLQDNCAAKPNPAQVDSDRDGIGNACDPDYDNNGLVGISDFNRLRAGSGVSQSEAAFDAVLDSNGDGVIDSLDFSTLRELFGSVPGPSGLACLAQADSCEPHYLDNDIDTFGSSPYECVCQATPNYTARRGGDCNDGDASVNPDAIEIEADCIDSNCDVHELLGGHLFEIEGDTTSLPVDVTITGDFDLKRFGTANLRGRMRCDAFGPNAADWCASGVITEFSDGALTQLNGEAEVCAAPTAPLGATLEGRAKVAGFPVDVRGTFDIDPDSLSRNYRLDITGEVDLEPDRFAFSGRFPVISAAGESFIEQLDGEQDWQIALSIGDSQLANGILLEGITGVLRPDEDSSAVLEVEATVKFGKAPNTVRLTAEGTLEPDADFSLTLRRADDEPPWKPFPDHLEDISLSDITGTLSRKDGVYSLEVSAAVAAQNGVEVAEGLKLTDITVTGRVDHFGDALVKVEGNAEVELGDSHDPREVALLGQVDNDGNLALQGEFLGPFEPLQDQIGSGRFVIEGRPQTPQDPAVPFAVTFIYQPATIFNNNTQRVDVIMQAPMRFCLFPNCGAAEEITAVAVGTGVLQQKQGKARFDGVFQVLLQNAVDLPQFNLDEVAFAAATVEIADVDLFLDDSVKRDLNRGISLAARTESPLVIDGIETVLFLFSIQDAAKLTLEADLGLDLPIIKPSDGFPKIHSATLKQLGLFGEIESASKLSLGLSGALEFYPQNQQATPLLGEAAFRVTLPSTVGGEVAMLGRWNEPLDLRDFAVQNPGITLDLDFSGGIPVPVSFGFNGDLFWAKDGDPFPALLPPQEGAPDPLPAGIVLVGGSYFYDKQPSQSDLCLLLACATTSPFLLRIEMENLQSADLSKASKLVNDVRAAVAFTPFVDWLPAGDLPPLDVAPVDIEVQRFKLVLATHTMELFGQPFDAGAQLDMNATVQGVNGEYFGTIDPDGIAFQGENDPIVINGLTVAGDPLWREADLGANGYLQIAHDPRLNVSTGTIEGWMRWRGGNGEFVNKLDAQDGYALTIEELPSGLGLLRLTVRNASRTRVFESAVTAADGDGAERLEPGGVLKQNRLPGDPVPDGDPSVTDALYSHLAYQFNEDLQAVFVDGKRVPMLERPAPAAVLFGAGFNTLPIQVGEGLERIDDVRLWSTLRSAADLVSGARRLPRAQLNPGAANVPGPELIARYEFDYDMAGSVVRNVREYPGGSTLPASLLGGATNAAPLAFSRLQSSLDVSNPLQSGRRPGFGVNAGIDVNIPNLPLPGQTLALFGKFDESNGQAEFYAEAFELMVLADLGSFFIGGLGRNGLDEQGGFDDGVYGQVNLQNKTFAGSGRLEFGKISPARTDNVLTVNALEASQWRMSSYHPVDIRIPWLGATLPADVTYSEPALNQTTAAGAGIYAGSNLSFFRTEFALPAGAQNIRIGLASRADNNIQIYLNGHELARYGQDLLGYTTPQRYLEVRANGTVVDGAAFRPFGNTPADFPNSNLVAGGMNRLDVVVRNLSAPDGGGFSLNLTIIFDLPQSGNVERFASGGFSFDQPAGALAMDGQIDISVPFGNSTLAISGAMGAGNQPLQISGAGNLSVLGYSFNGPTITVDSNSATFVAPSFELPVPSGFLAGVLPLADLSTASTSYTVDFAERSLCGTATSVSLGGFSCNLSACVYADVREPSFSGSCTGGYPFCNAESNCGASEFCNDLLNVCQQKLPIGGVCAGLGNEACSKGSCNGANCQCNSTADCAGGQFCNAAKVCQSKLPTGAACLGDDYCQTSVCRNNVCQCNSNGDCAASQWCNTTGPANVCAPDVPVYAVCPAGPESCRTGKCGVVTVGVELGLSICGLCSEEQCGSEHFCEPYGGSCYPKLPPFSVCALDKQCQSSARCVAGVCRPTGIGEQCISSGNCSVGTCVNGICQCGSNSDCAAAQFCYFNGANALCYNDLAPPFACLSGAGSCTTGNCVAPISGIGASLCSVCSAGSCGTGSFCVPGGSCTPKFGLNVGCSGNIECLSGLCIGGVCSPAGVGGFCRSDAECSTGLCNGSRDPTQPIGTCISAYSQSLSFYCDRAESCTSNRCTGHIGGFCIPFACLGAGAVCSSNADCCFSGQCNSVTVPCPVPWDLGRTCTVGACL